MDNKSDHKKERKLESTLIKYFCVFSIIIVALFAVVAGLITAFNNSQIISMLEERYIPDCEGKSRYDDMAAPGLKESGGWFEVLDLNYERLYPAGEYKKYTSLEMIDIGNGDYRLHEHSYRGIVRTFRDGEGDERIQVIFFPAEFIDVTQTVKLPVRAAALRFMGIYIVGVLLFALGYFLTIHRMSGKIEAKVTVPLNLLREAMKELGSGRYERRLSLSGEYEFVEMAASFNCMAREMEAAVRRREEEERLRRQLIADLSHDIRTPLTVIQGYLITVIRDMTLNNQDITYLQRCYDSSMEMEALLERLSDYNRMFRVDYRIRRESVDLTEFLKEILADQYHQFELNGRQLRVGLDDRERPVLIDRREMQRAIINLINNAVQHNGDGTAVWVGIIEQEGKLCAVVADSGDEIPESVKSCMYEPFAKGEQSRHNSGNSGLGLAIVKKIVEAHGAGLRFEQPWRTYSKAFIIEFDSRRQDG